MPVQVAIRGSRCWELLDRPVEAWRPQGSSTSPPPLPSSHKEHREPGAEIQSQKKPREPQQAVHFADMKTEAQEGGGRGVNMC